MGTYAQTYGAGVSRLNGGIGPIVGDASLYGARGIKFDSQGHLWIACKFGDGQPGFLFMLGANGEEYNWKRYGQGYTDADLPILPLYRAAESAMMAKIGLSGQDDWQIKGLPPPPVQSLVGAIVARNQGPSGAVVKDPWKADRDAGHLGLWSDASPYQPLRAATLADGDQVYHQDERIVISTPGGNMAVRAIVNTIARMGWLYGYDGIRTVGDGYLALSEAFDIVKFAVGCVTDNVLLIESALADAVQKIYDYNEKDAVAAANGQKLGKLMEQARQGTPPAYAGTASGLPAISQLQSHSNATIALAASIGIALVAGATLIG